MKIIKSPALSDLPTILKRDSDATEDLEKQVRIILNNVRENKDQALIDYTKEFDKADLKELRVSEDEINEALNSVEPEIYEIFKEAAQNIRNFHVKQKEKTWIEDFGPGIQLGQKITPLKEVGVYVPGGRASYPSTVLMDVIPAKVAGVERIVMVTPPDSNGKINDEILAAAHVAGVDEIYKVGGAQAIGALAYGTESISPVDKIVGPGNIFVALAKKNVFGTVAIDMIAGPSEVLVLADESAKPNVVAADLLAQAEHDPRAQAILVTTSEELANEVLGEIEKQVDDDINRKEIAKESIDNFGYCFVVKDLDEGVRVVNVIAPEHLELQVENPEELVEDIQNAGAIFIGPNTPEPLGDYFAGPNHTLPTGGTAKFSSPLGVYDFQKRSSLLNYSKDALTKVKDKVIKFAQSEGLDAHANSIKQRMEIEE